MAGSTIDDDDDDNILIWNNFLSSKEQNSVITRKPVNSLTKNLDQWKS